MTNKSFFCLQIGTLVLCLAAGVTSRCNDIDHCETCINAPLQCYLCAERSALKEDKSTCIDCPSYCKRCEVKDRLAWCKECDEGFTINSIGHCVPCPHYCKECEIEAGGNMTCQACVNGFSYNSVENLCTKCPPFCAECVEDTDGKQQCNACHSGYILDQSRIPKQCLVCPPTCAMCNASRQDGNQAKCFTCKSGSILKKGRCIECTKNCERCEDVSTCQVCNDYFRVQNGTCLDCPPLCEQCEENNQTVSCLTCDSGYAEKSFISCDYCGDHCQSCSDSSGCNKCQTGYTDYDGKCYACPSSCNDCLYDSVRSQTTCRSSGCDVRFAFKHMDKSCVSCGAGCTKCTYNAMTSTVECLPDKCDVGFRFDINSTSCRACETGCASCNLTSGLMPKPKHGIRVDGICEACPANCHSCKYDDGRFVCVSGGCNIGYEEREGLCQECPPDCNFCSYNIPKKEMRCTPSGCKPEFVMDENGNCVACPPNCRECSYNIRLNEISCHACKNSVLLGPAGSTCQACPEHCRDCVYNSQKNSTECLTNQCESGYGMTYNKACIACPANCETCKVDAYNKTVCEVCAARNWKNTGVCGACPRHCLNCTEKNGIMMCTACKDGYVMNTMDKTCHKCPDNCDSCSIRQGMAVCDECKAGFFISRDKTLCQGCDKLSIDHCKTCHNSTCITCNEGYTMKDDHTECLPCSSLGSCAVCEDKAFECSLCDHGYQLTPDKKCSRLCFACGEKNGNNWKSDTGCEKIDSVSGGSGTKSCNSGSCWVYRQSTSSDSSVAYVRSCEQRSCDKNSVFEFCKEANGYKECSKCCDGNKCNIFRLTGITESGTTGRDSNLLLISILVLMHTIYMQTLEKPRI